MFFEVFYNARLSRRRACPGGIRLVRLNSLFVLAPESGTEDTAERDFMLNVLYGILIDNWVTVGFTTIRIPTMDVDIQSSEAGFVTDLFKNVYYHHDLLNSLSKRTTIKQFPSERFCLSL